MGNIGDIATIGLVAGIGYIVLKNWGNITSGFNSLKSSVSSTVANVQNDPVKVASDLAETYKESGEIVKQPAHLALDLFDSDLVVTGPAELLTKIGTGLYDAFTGGSSSSGNPSTSSGNPSTSSGSKSNTLSVLSGTDAYKSLQSSISGMTGLSASQKRDLERSLRSKLITN